MAGRAFAFADPRIIELAKTKFVPVTCDDWYQRRRTDDEGKFWKQVWEQGPRKGSGTKQGIYAFTADGTLLEFKNAGQDAEATLDQLQRALKKWDALPAAKRQSFVVPPHGKVDERYNRVPPEGGAILKCYGRILDIKDAAWCRGTCEKSHGMKASRDFAWLSAADVAELAKKPAAMPPAILQRLMRFHLVDNTQGEPVFWKRADVKRAATTLTVVDANTLQLDGTVLLTSKDDRGYEARLGGTITFKDGKLAAFDVVCVGEHWGDDSVTKSGSRPGRSWYGVNFSLADAKNPSERVSPQAARDWDLYMGKRED